LRVITEELQLLSFCPDPLCEHGGYRQVTVPGIRETVIKTFGDSSTGNSSDPIDIAYANLESTSNVYFRFANPEDSVCACGLTKTCNDQQRPIYENLTASLTARQKAAKENERTEELVEEIAERLGRAEAANRKAAVAGPKP
jgi:hypothetical protein